MNFFTKAMIPAVILGLAATYVYSAKTTGTSSAPATTTSATTATINSSVSPAERTKIEEVVKDYLLQKPEVIIQAIQNFQQKQYMQAEETIKQTQKDVGAYTAQLFHQTNDPIAGNPAGKVTIVEFFDYQCPHCADMAPVVAAIIKANPDVRFVFKEFPIRGPASELAARAALAANKQGKYFEFSHALLSAKQPITQELIDQTAKNVGLNVDQLKKDMTDKAIDQQIKDTTKLAQSLKLFGTPAFIIGKTDAKSTDTINYVPGQMDQAQLQGLIDKSK